MKAPGQVLGGSTQTSWVLFVDSAGLRLPVLAPDTLHRGCPWHPGEPHAKNKGVFILRGGPLQAQLPCLLGRATHTPELPWRTTTLCSYISRTLPQVTAWLGSSHAPSGPPRVLPSQGIDWGSLFQSLCLGKVAEFSK